MLLESRKGEFLQREILRLYKTYGDRLLVRFSSAERETFNPDADYFTTPIGTYAYPVGAIFHISEDDVVIDPDMYGVSERKYMYFFVASKDASWLNISSQHPAFEIPLVLYNQFRNYADLYDVSLDDVFRNRNSMESYLTYWCFAIASRVFSDLTETLKQNLMELLRKDLPRMRGYYQELSNICREFDVDVSRFYHARNNPEEWLNLLIAELLDRLNSDFRHMKSAGDVKHKYFMYPLIVVIALLHNRYAPYPDSIEAAYNIGARKDPVVLTSFLRKVGYDGIWDHGTGAIHSNEPAQVVWWKPTAARLVNKMDNPLYVSPSSIGFGYLAFADEGVAPSNEKQKKYLWNLILSGKMDEFIEIMDMIMYRKYLAALFNAFLNERRVALKHAIGFKAFKEYLKQNAEEIRNFFRVSSNAPVQLVWDRFRKAFRISELLRNYEELIDRHPYEVDDFAHKLLGNFNFLKELIKPTRL